MRRRTEIRQDGAGDRGARGAAAVDRVRCCCCCGKCCAASRSSLPPPSRCCDTWELIIDPFFDNGGTDVGLFWHLSASLKRVALGFRWRRSAAWRWAC